MFWFNLKLIHYNAKRKLFRSCAELFVWYEKFSENSILKVKKLESLLLHKLRFINFWNIHPLPFVQIFHIFCVFNFSTSLNQRQKKSWIQNHEQKTSKRKLLYVQRTPLQDDEDDHYSLRLVMFCGWEITCNYSYCLLQIMRLFNLFRVGVGNEK